MWTIAATMFASAKEIATSSTSRKDWCRLLLVVAVGTALLAIPRWGHHTPDSKHYLAFAECLCKSERSCALLAPFAYRIVASSVACLVPSPNLDVAFALQNVFWSGGAIAGTLALAHRTGSGRLELATCSLLMIVSFPMLNYSSGVLSDPSGLFFLVLGLLLIQADKWFVAALVAGLAVLARESNLVLVLTAISVAIFSNALTPRKRVVGALSLMVIAVGAFVSIRLALGPIPSSVLTPSIGRLVKNLTRLESWLTVSLTIGPVLLLIAARRQAILARLRSFSPSTRALYVSALLGVCATFVLGLFGAFMSGRFLWPLYPVAIPFVAAGLRGTFVERLFSTIVYGRA